MRGPGEEGARRGAAQPAPAKRTLRCIRCWPGSLWIVSRGDEAL